MVVVYFVQVFRAIFLEIMNETLAWFTHSRMPQTASMYLYEKCLFSLLDAAYVRTFFVLRVYFREL